MSKNISLQGGENETERNLDENRIEPIMEEIFDFVDESNNNDEENKRNDQIEDGQINNFNEVEVEVEAEVDNPKFNEPEAEEEEEEEKEEKEFIAGREIGIEDDSTSLKLFICPSSN